MKRLLSFLLLGILSGAAAAQEPTPPSYTKAEVVAAARYCLETFRELEANTRRFPIEEFGMPVYPNNEVLNSFATCVLYRLENDDFKVIPLA